MINTMTLARTTFDTLGFAKRLEAAGEKAEIAEAQAELQMELHAKILEKIESYQPIIEEIKITKDQTATKNDISSLKADILDMDKKINQMDKKIIQLDSKVDNLRNELIVKLGGIVAAGVIATTATLGIIIALINR